MKKLLTSILTLIFSINISFSQNEEINEQVIQTDTIECEYEISNDDFTQNEEINVQIVQTDTIECEYEVPNDDFPQYVIKNEKTIGIIFTVEQVQKIDSDLELLKLFKQLSFESKSIEEYYVTIVNDQNSKIIILETTINELKSKSNDKDKIIEDLRNQVSKWKKANELSNEEIQNNQIIIEELKSDINKEKTKKIIGITTSSTIGAVLLALTIYLGIR